VFPKPPLAGGDEAQVLACHPWNPNSRPLGPAVWVSASVCRFESRISARHGRAGTGSVGAGHDYGDADAPGGPWDRASTPSDQVPSRRLARVAGTCR